LDISSFGNISGAIYVNSFSRIKISTNAVNYTGNPVSWYITIILTFKIKFL